MRTICVFAFPLLAAFPGYAQDFRGIEARQLEIAASASLSHYPGLTKAGVTVDGGINVHPHFAFVGDYSYTPLGSESMTLYGTSVEGSARFHSIQGGGRLNILSRGRLIPYAVGTAGLVRIGVSASLSSPDVSFSRGASENRFGFGMGGGLIVRASRHIDVKLDARALKGKDIEWIERVSLGVGYRF